MNQYVDEEVNWQRLKDIQREIEYSRFVATHGVPAILHLAGVLARRVRTLAGLVSRQAPPPHDATVVLEVLDDDQDVASVA